MRQTATGIPQEQGPPPAPTAPPLSPPAPPPQAGNYPKAAPAPKQPPTAPPVGARPANPPIENFELPEGFHPDWGHECKLYVLYGGGVPSADLGLWRCSWQQFLRQWGNGATAKGYDLSKEQEARNWARAFRGSEEWAHRPIRNL